MPVEVRLQEPREVGAGIGDRVVRPVQRRPGRPPYACAAASSAQNGSSASRVSIRSASLICLPRMSMLTELAIDAVVGRWTNAPPARPALTRTRFWTSRIRSASRTVARLIWVCLTSSRSAGRAAPSGSSPLRIRSRNSRARTSGALGTSTGLSVIDRERVRAVTLHHASSMDLWSDLNYHPSPPRRPQPPGVAEPSQPGDMPCTGSCPTSRNLYADSLREWLGARAGRRNRCGRGSTPTTTPLRARPDRRGLGRGRIRRGSVGGQGGGLLELALTSRELGRAAAPSARWLVGTWPSAALTGAPALVQRRPGRKRLDRCRRSVRPDPVRRARR